MAKWSLMVGALGVCGTGAVLVHRSRGTTQLGPEQLWFLGLASLAPAWLIAFVSLLEPPTGPRPEAAASAWWIRSSAAALLGVILTDVAVRRLHESGRARRPVTYWLLGLVALVPAWGLALWRLL